MWELCEAMRSLPPERLVLLVPMTRGAYEEFRRDAEKEFFVRGIQVKPERGAPRTPRLPSRVVRGWEDDLSVGIREQSTPTATKGAVYFTRDWEPVHVSLAGGPMVSSLGIYDHLPRALGKGLIPAFLQLVAHEGRLARGR